MTWEYSQGELFMIIPENKFHKWHNVLGYINYLLLLVFAAEKMPVFLFSQRQYFQFLLNRNVFAFNHFRLRYH